MVLNNLFYNPFTQEENNKYTTNTEHHHTFKIKLSLTCHKTKDILNLYSNLVTDAMSITKLLPLHYSYKIELYCTRVKKPQKHIVKIKINSLLHKLLNNMHLKSCK